MKVQMRMHLTEPFITFNVNFQFDHESLKWCSIRTMYWKTKKEEKEELSE